MVGFVSFRCFVAIDLEVLKIYRNRDVSHASLCQCRTARLISEILDMIRPHRPLIENACVNEQLVKLDILLRQRADQIVIMQSRESHTG